MDLQEFRHKNCSDPATSDGRLLRLTEKRHASLVIWFFFNISALQRLVQAAHCISINLETEQIESAK